MVSFSRSNILKLILFLISFLSLTLSFLIITSISRLEHNNHHHHIIDFHHEHNSEVNESSIMISHMPMINEDRSVIRREKKHSLLPLDFFKRVFKGKKEIKIGLVNIGNDQGKEWKELGNTSVISFGRVSKNRRWKDYFPEWIDEEEKWRPPSCLDIPMPKYENYDEFHVVVANLPCGNESEKEGIRDVFRLQVNLVIANLVVRNSRNIDGHDRSIYVVFIGSCGPMWELFICDDLIGHEGKVWIYKPDLRRLKQKVLMPVGTCQLGLTYKKQGEAKFNHSLSKLNKPIEFDHPKEAFVTILHSSEAYVCGAIALAQSIIQTNSTKDFVLLADKSISEKSIRGLQAAGWKIKLIQRIRSPLAEKDAYNKWNYSKLRIWQLTQYDKIIFIDSDLVVLENIDEFFEYPQLSAVGNDQVLFNSGLMLIEPSNCVFEMLMKKRYTLKSYNGGDQGFLNEAFTWWHRLPTKLNYLKNYEDVNDTKHVLPVSVYAIHYLGLKPWMCYRDYDCNWDKLDHRLFASDSAHKKWWRVYDAMPKHLHGFCDLSKNMDMRIKKWRKIAENAGLPDEHWKIKVKDPRQHH